MPDSKSIAFKAVMSIAQSNPAHIDEFVEYLSDAKLSPVARIYGYPVYRFDDISRGENCYLSDERSGSIYPGFVATHYSVFGSYLQFSNGVTEQSQSFVVSYEIINKALESQCDGTLTAAELRLVIQLVAGLELKRAASQDCVSVETKRSQMKSIAAKLGANRQQDVIRLVLPALTRLTDPAGWEREAQAPFNRYVNRFLPEAVRCHTITDAEQRSVRIIDYGPVRGRPVIVLHPLIFPDITDADVAFAEEHDLRLIWPLRPGVLQGDQNRQSIQSYTDDTLAGIDLAWAHLCGEPVPVIAMVSSAWHAVAYAKSKPQNVTDITFAATCFSAGKYENSLIYFGSSVAELCSRNVWLMTKTVDFIRKNVSDISRFRATIMRVHQGSSPDVTVLDREFASINGGDRLKMALVDSPESVKHDFFNQVHFRWKSINGLKPSVKFVHGGQDSIHKIDDVRKLISGIGDFPLVVFERAGHIMQYEHFQQLVCESLDLPHSIDAA